MSTTGSQPSASGSTNNDAKPVDTAIAAARHENEEKEQRQPPVLSDTSAATDHDFGGGAKTMAFILTVTLSQLVTVSIGSEKQLSHRQKPLNPLHLASSTADLLGLVSGGTDWRSRLSRAYHCSRHGRRQRCTSSLAPRFLLVRSPSPLGDWSPTDSGCPHPRPVSRQAYLC